MFIEQNDPEDLEKKNALATNQTVGAGGGGVTPLTGSPSTGNFSTTTNVTPAQPEQKFASVQDYLKANQPQGAQLGKQFAEKLESTASAEKGAIDTAATAAQQEITAALNPFKAELVNKAATSPTEITSDQGKLSDFLKQWNSAYAGPSSLESSAGYAPANKAVIEGQQKAAQIGSTGGREQLLQDEFGVYGQGNKGLAAALMQTSPSEARIQGTIPQFTTGLTDYLKGKSGEVSRAATSAQQEATATKEQTRGTFANKLSEFQKSLSDRTDMTREQVKAITDKYQTDLAAGKADSIVEDLKDAGVPDDQIQDIQMSLSTLNQTYGTSPKLTNYYTFNPATDINTGNVATPEDYAKAAAYEKLTGAGYGGVLNPANTPQASTDFVTQAKQGLQSGQIQQYLKGTLAQKDKELLGSPPPPITGDNTEPNIISSATKVLDIMKRGNKELGKEWSDFMANLNRIGSSDPKAAAQFKDLYNQYQNLKVR